VDLTIRPRPGRLRQPVAVIVVIAGVFLLCTAGAAVNHVGTDKPVNVPYLLTALTLVLVPLVALLAFMAMNRWNVFLRWVDGRLELGEWTGRVVRVDRPRSIRSFPAGDGSLLVVAGQQAQAPIILNPGWWAEEDLGRLLSTLDLPVTEEPDGAVLPGTSRAYPGSRQPFSVRHPALFLITVFGGSVAWLAAMAFLVTHL